MHKLAQALLVSAMLVVANASLASQSPWQPVEQQGSALNAEQVAAQFSVDFGSLQQFLSAVPHQALQDFSHELQLPMPDGSVARYSVVEAPIMQPQLAQTFPQIRTFKVFGIDDPAATGRVDISPRGFYGMLHTSSGRVFIDPEQNLVADGLYLAQYAAAMTGNQQFSCGVHDVNFAHGIAQTTEQQAAERIPGMLRQYLLAVSATEEYVTAVGPPPPGDTPVENAQAAIVTAINRVNQIYERDVGITLALVGNNNLLIENAGNVSFTNTDPFSLFDENQCWIDTTIGEMNYDIGHVFSTGAGGVARLTSVCDPTVKAHGVTGLSNPVGDPFYIDFVAHEIGHQFGANHTFNGTVGSCGSNRVPASAMEPGSGSTIMGYTAICGSENLQIDADATFHARSIDEITTFAGSVSCHIPVSTTPANNNDPVITAIPNYTIPSGTAFVLSGSASDADGDTSIYQWDQMDAGSATTATTFGQDLGDNALFRTYEPTTGFSTRHFPALNTQLFGRYDKAEVLPCNSRQINLRLTARDNNSGQDIEDVAINVTSAGPFEVTNISPPGPILFSSSPVTLTWDVAGTSGTPVNCATVDIDLLTFSPGYATYTAHPVAQNVTNDGVQAFNILPATDSASLARFRISCPGNIFYDISDTDLEIRGSAFPGPTFDTSSVTTVFTNNTTTSLVPPTCGNPRPASQSAASGFDASLAAMLTPAINRAPALRPGSVGNMPASCAFVGTTGDDSSSEIKDATLFDPIWLLLLGGLFGFRRWIHRQG